MRPMFLAAAHEGLAQLEKPSDHPPTRNPHWMATSRLQDVLAMEVPTATWAT